MTPVPTPTSLPGPGLTGVNVFELVIAILFAAGGVRSFVRWIRRPLLSTSVREQVLYALHLTGRIGLWFAFAGFFLVYALLEEPQRFRWYFLVPVTLASLQLATAMALSRIRE